MKGFYHFLYMILYVIQNVNLRNVSSSVVETRTILKLKYSRFSTTLEVTGIFIVLLFKRTQGNIQFKHIYLLWPQQRLLNMLVYQSS